MTAIEQLENAQMRLLDNSIEWARSAELGQHTACANLEVEREALTKVIPRLQIQAQAEAEAARHELVGKIATKYRADFAKCEKLLESVRKRHTKAVGTEPASRPQKMLAKAVEAARAGYPELPKMPADIAAMVFEKLDDLGPVRCADTLLRDLENPNWKRGKTAFERQASIQDLALAAQKRAVEEASERAREVYQPHGLMQRFLRTQRIGWTEDVG